ncbi:class I SAM-dependent methyltransferase [Priestia megaterium]
MLDLACGTGELSVRFAQEGFSVVGVDLSDDMLMVAQEKAAEAGLTLSLFSKTWRNLSY